MKPIFRLIRLTLSPFLSFGVIRRFSFNVMKIDNLIEVKVDDIRFLVNTSDKVISKNIYSNLKFPEYEKFNLSMNILKENGISINNLVDIGAHYGSISIPAALEYDFNKIYAFEPIYENLKILELNILLNDLSANFLTFNNFLDSSKKQLTVYNFINNTAASIAMNSEANLEKYMKINNLEYKNQESHESQLLDEILKNYTLQETLFWLYCQGKEIDIILSSEKIIKDKSPICMGYAPLVNQSSDKTIEDLCTRLNDSNYSTIVDLNEPDYKNSIDPNTFFDLDNKYKYFSRNTILLIY